MKHIWNWIEHFFMASLSYLIFKISPIEIVEIPLFTPFLILLTFVKCFYFVMVVLEGASKFYRAKKSFFWFLMHFSLAALMVIWSFTTENVIINLLDADSFSNLPEKNHLFNFFYYSFMSFTASTFGEMAAESWLARLYSMLAVFMGFVFAAYILSGIVNFKDEIKDKFID